MPGGARQVIPAARPQRRAGVIPLGVRDASETLLDVAAAGGLGLTGPGAPAAARAILASVLAEPAPGQPGLPAEIIIPAADADALLPGHDLTGLPGLLIPATLAAALDALEAAVVRQARTTSARPPGDDPGGDGEGDGGQDNVPGGVPGPATVLIAACDPGAAARLRGITRAARGLGVAAVVLGPWQPGITCQAAAGGEVAGVMPPDPRLDGMRLYGLDAGETAAITALLREAHGTPPPAAARAPAPAADPGPPAPARIPPARPGRADAPAAREQGEAPPAGTSPPVTVHVLGPVRVTAAGEEIGGGLRKARELLAFLAVHRDGASGEVISEALWPAASPERALSQRQAAVRKARRLLRSATGRPGPMWVTLAAGRYRLDPAVITTDLWQLTDALAAARRASQDEPARLAAFRAAGRLYCGELADGAGYDWAEAPAEDIRRQALDAWTGIADIVQARDPGQALAALETALGHDPYNESLYQRIMRLQAGAGHPEAVRRTLDLLEARLAELGISAGARTREVAAALLGPAGPASPPPRPPRPLAAPRVPQRRAG
jgi:DNA-binding SARP family transcriptional activator